MIEVDASIVMHTALGVVFIVLGTVISFCFLLWKVISKQRTPEVEAEMLKLYAEVFKDTAKTAIERSKEQQQIVSDLLNQMKLHQEQCRLLEKPTPREIEKGDLEKKTEEEIDLRVPKSEPKDTTAAIQKETPSEDHDTDSARDDSSSKKSEESA